MTKSCVCDSIYGADGKCCEPAIQHLCDAIKAPISSLASYHHGQPIEFSEATVKAAMLLKNSKYPLFVGIEELGIKAQQSAVELCRSVNGVVDSNSRNQGRSSAGFSLAREGKVEATMGEVLQRSQAIIAIDCEPFGNHLRFTKQLEDRPWFWIGTEQPPMQSSDYLTVAPDELDNLLIGIQAILENIPVHGGFDRIQIESSIGNSSEASNRSIIEGWIEQWSTLDHVALMHNSSSTEPEFDVQCDTLTSIVRALNRNSHAVAIDLSSHCNCTGAENVLAWSSGFSQATDFSNGVPTSFGLEYSAENIVQRKECDLVVEFIGPNGDTIACHDIQKISISSNRAAITSAEIAFCAVEFLEDTFLRFDGVSYELARDNGGELTARDVFDEIKSSSESTN